MRQHKPTPKHRLSARTSRLRAALLSAALAPLLTACLDAGPREVPESAQPRYVEPAAPVRVALVLSGGSLRGLAHLGVLRALEANGLRPDLIVGSSAGAIAGALYASGRGADDLAGAALHDELDPWGAALATRDTRSRQLEGFLAAGLRQAHIEDFPLRFAAVAAERHGGCLAVFNAGDASRAVGASSAMPGVFAPALVAGRDHVDGGMVAPLPVRVARDLGAQLVVAVDVTWHADMSAPDGIVDSVFHAGMLMARNLSAADRANADLVIEPRLPPVAEVTLANRAALIQAGERAALAALPQLRAMFATGAGPSAHAEESRVGAPTRCESLERRTASAASAGSTAAFRSTPHPTTGQQ